METVAQRGAEVWGRQQDVIFDALRPFYEEPLVLVEGQGVFVTDAEGRVFISPECLSFDELEGHINALQDDLDQLRERAKRAFQQKT